MLSKRKISLNNSSYLEHPLPVNSQMQSSILLLGSTLDLVGWLVVFGLNDPLRQYFSLYRVVSQREGEREEKG